MAISSCSTISGSCMAARRSPRRITSGICAAATSHATVSTAQRRFCAAHSKGGAVMSLAEEIFAIFERRGAGAYFGERVSMTQHALQAAYFAQAEAAPPPLIVASLLHDIGHLIE